MKSKLKKIILLLGDVAVLYFALYLTLLLRYFEAVRFFDWQNHFAPFTTVFVFWPIIFYIADLYNLHLAVNNAKFFQLSAQSIGITSLLTAAYFYLNPAITIAPKTNLLIYIFVFAVLFFLWRRIFNYFLLSRLTKEKIAFIGCNNQVKELVYYLQKRPHIGYETALIASSNLIDKISGIHTTNDVENLDQTIARLKISTVVLASDPHQSQELRATLFRCLPLKINFISLPNFYESLVGKIPLEAINQMWFLENLSEGKKTWYDFLKRFYDIVLALLLLLATAFFWPLIGIIIKLESPGKIFYKQIRAGKNEKAFTVIKFRTMRADAEKDGPKWAKNTDPRVTAFGRFLRRTRIDEIPQVLNILNNTMSFIGPRPERPEFTKQLKQNIPFYNERSLIKPGLTGWAQVNFPYGASEEDALEKLQYDLYYLKNRSLYLDLTIILKTIKTVLSRAGI